MADWSELSFSELSRRYESLVSGIRTDLETLAEVGPALAAKAAALGATVNLDHSSLARLASDVAGPRRGGGRRRAVTKQQRFLLVWTKTGQPVKDEAGQPMRFKNRVKVLRGPRYDRLIGADKVHEVQLVDTEAGNKVVHDELELGPAPGTQA